MRAPSRGCVFLFALSASACGDAARDDLAAADVDDALDTEPDAARPALVVSTVAPAVVDPLGGSTLAVRGRGFLAADGVPPEVAVGGASCRVEVVSDGELRAVTSALAGPAQGLDLEVVRADGARAELDAALEAWSPAELEGARVFDAAVGVVSDDEAENTTPAAPPGTTTVYEWQRLTADIGPDWRVRDGNTTTWLPATQRYWMVGGWNGFRAPAGFSSVEPDTVYPPENTTDEVWSSADGIDWRLERAHGTAGFERRHAHNALVFRDRLWLIGGDHHTGHYNHDVVSSADGVHWTVELGPDTTPPPWAPRALQVSGVYAGAMWTAGGQDAVGDPALAVHHNDVWRSEDGVHWTEVVADAPASATRWAGCGVLDGLVEFKGRMWLVGCARERADAVGHSMSNEVWSTTDGATWTRHADPPWQGKIWPNVVVWDGRLWILFGYTLGDLAAGWTQGNANEAWFSDDGESWQHLPIDAPVPGSHAQGIAVRPDFVLMAGGNYSFGGASVDKSVWRLVPFRGEAVAAWIDRGAGALRLEPPSARPVRVADAFGLDRPGLQFDGSAMVLDLVGGVADAQPGGRTVLWVARAPYLPVAVGWSENYNPAATIVGGTAPDGFPVASLGFTDGRVSYVNRSAAVDALGSPIWQTTQAGDALQAGTGAVHLAGLTHAADGAVQIWVDGAPLGAPGVGDYATPRSWSRIGGGLDAAGEGAVNRFGGALGAVIVLPFVADAATQARIHAWAQGRFGVP